MEAFTNVKEEREVKSEMLSHFSLYLSKIKNKKIIAENTQVSRDFLSFHNTDFDNTFNNLVVLLLSLA